MNGKFPKRTHVTIRTIPMVFSLLESEGRTQAKRPANRLNNCKYIQKKPHIYSLDFTSNILKKGIDMQANKLLFLKNISMAKRVLAPCQLANNCF